VTGRLSDASLDRIPPGVARPGYDRAAIRTGIVHLGPGAFHRGHQAAYADALLETDPRWGICAVSLRSPDAADALNPQNGLYALARLDADSDIRVIGSIREVLVAPREPEAVLDRLAAPDTRLVTLTVTEKGYCLDADDRLDETHPDIVHDIENPRRPISAIGHLVEGLRLRREAGLQPFTVLCCDNLSDNGIKLAAATAALARRTDPALADHIESSVAFPRSMVDSITPATDDALRARVRDVLGMQDAWPIQREAFTSWVIEDVPGADLPDFASVGAILTRDVAGHAAAKLRLLNGPHSALAYLGLAAGHETVAEAMADPMLAGFVEDLMTAEIRPSVTAPDGLDLDAYIAAVIKRFRNRAIAHQLAQIAWDGSQKLPIRLLDTARDNLAAGRQVEGIAAAVAAWMRFIRRRSRDGMAITDPQAERLAAVGRACEDRANADVARFVTEAGVVPAALASEPRFIAALERGYATVQAVEDGRADVAGLRAGAA
jgi:fructuronate reductase